MIEIALLVLIIWGFISHLKIERLHQKVTCMSITYYDMSIQTKKDVSESAKLIVEAKEICKQLTWVSNEAHKALTIIAKAGKLTRQDT